MSLALNALRAVAIRVLTPYTGAWQAEVDFDLAEVPVMPTGKAILTIGTSGVLNGTIDERDAGKFGPKASARVVAGGGGWERIVPARAYHNDAGVLTTAVLATTGAEVGETVVDTTPARLGIDFVRTAGPAARVLAGLSWYVNPQGVTIIAPRAPIPTLPTAVEVLDWNPREHRAEIATDELLQPGSILVDSRFGTVTVRDVEQTFTDRGARATAWCSASTPSKVAAGGRLVAALGALAREATGSPFLKEYRYRVVKDVVGRYLLQAVTKSLGVPEMIGPLTAWTGAAGVTAKLKLGAVVLVGFIEGDPAQPLLLGYQGSDVPLQVDVDGLIVRINKGAQGAARMGDAVVAGPFGGTITTGSATVKIGN